MRFRRFLAYMKLDINLQVVTVCVRLLNYLTMYLTTCSQLVYEQIMKMNFSSLYNRSIIWKISAPIVVLAHSSFGFLFHRDRLKF